MRTQVSFICKVKIVCSKIRFNGCRHAPHVHQIVYKRIIINGRDINIGIHARMPSRNGAKERKALHAKTA